MIKILIWAYKSRPNKTGMLPLYVRITVNKQREQWATGIEIEPNKFSSDTQRIKGRSVLVKAQNESLDRIRADLLRCYNDLNEVFHNVTARDVRLNYQREPEVSLGLIEVFDEYISRMERLTED